jgi:uncharacterized membrane protein
MTPLAQRLSIVLAISIALNLLFLGFVVGRRVRPFHGPHGVPGMPSAGMNHGARGPLRGALAPNGPELAARRKAIQDARSRVADALERDPFDQAALESALAALRAESNQTQELVHRRIATFAASNGVEIRRELARTFRQKRGPLR